MFQLLLTIIYLSFISLGLPDGLLGAAWPTMFEELGVPVSYAGILSFIICVGTIVSSLLSDRLTHWLGAGKITAISVSMTAIALLGFSFSSSFGMLCLLAIPYGLGAGSVDAALNNYVALHYSSRHMSWLHCMWGIGASSGPYIMGLCLSVGKPWNMGYRWIGLIQVVLTAILFISLPIWFKRNKTEETPTSENPLSLQSIFRLPGAKEIMIAFFCYCALEQTAGLWAASYLTFHAGLSEKTAASYAGIFFLGMTVGRAISGFVASKYNDTQMIRFGFVTIAIGLVALLLPFGWVLSLIGLLLIGLGCAPIYPCVIHATPEHFGADKSQALIGVQMASAYIGTALMPPLFGIIAEHLHISLLGIYLSILLVLMVICHETMVRKCK